MKNREIKIIKIIDNNIIFKYKGKTYKKYLYNTKNSYIKCFNFNYKKVYISINTLKVYHIKRGGKL